MRASDDVEGWVNIEKTEDRKQRKSGTFVIVKTSVHSSSRRQAKSAQKPFVPAAVAAPTSTAEMMLHGVLKNGWGGKHPCNSLAGSPEAGTAARLRQGCAGPHRGQTLGCGCRVCFSICIHYPLHRS
jgi:hypothetical protein